VILAGFGFGYEPSDDPEAHHGPHGDGHEDGHARPGDGHEEETPSETGSETGSGAAAGEAEPVGVSSTGSTDEPAAEGEARADG
jgi:hypothetical protein